MAADPNTKVILCLDVDCFSVQILCQEFPQLAKRPLVILNEHSAKLGAVSYEAREYGITRKTKLEDAKALCPQLLVANIDLDCEDKDPLETSRLATYNIGGVIRDYITEKLCLSHQHVECASADEFYVDLTKPSLERIQEAQHSGKLQESPKIYFEDKYQCTGLTADNFNDEANDFQRNIFIQGGVIAQDLFRTLRSDKRTKLRFSGGIAHNKLLAKLACDLHRPYAVTVLNPDGFDRVSTLVKIDSLPGLKKSKGAMLKEALNISSLHELGSVSDDVLLTILGGNLVRKTRLMATGIDHSGITPMKLQSNLFCRTKCGDRELSYKDMITAVRLVCKRMEIRLEEERERNNRQPLDLKLQVKPGGVTELEMPSSLSWESLLCAAMVKLDGIYDQTKLVCIHQVALYVKKFSTG